MEQIFKKIENGHYESADYIIRKGEYKNIRVRYTSWRLFRKSDNKYIDCNSLKVAKEVSNNNYENWWSTP